MYWVLIGEIAFLFFSSQFIFKSLFSLCYMVLRSRKMSMGLVSVLFFPGVFIHELAHYVMARMLFVKSVSFNMVPHFEENHIRLGSVEIVKTDPIRRLLIGLAPVLLGIGVLWGMMWWGSRHIILELSHFDQVQVLIVILLLYGVFVISNTMFSSKKDIEGAGLLLVLGVIILALLTFLGVNIPEITQNALKQPFIQEYSRQLSLLLLIPVGINLLLLILFLFVKRRTFRTVPQ